MKPTKREGTNIKQEQGAKDMDKRGRTIVQTFWGGGNAQTGEGVNETQEQGVAKGTDQQWGRTKHLN